MCASWASTLTLDDSSFSASPLSTPATATALAPRSPAGKTRGSCISLRPPSKGPPDSVNAHKCLGVPRHFINNPRMNHIQAGNTAGPKAHLMDVLNDYWSESVKYCVIARCAGGKRASEASLASPACSQCKVGRASDLGPRRRGWRHTRGVHGRPAAAGRGLRSAAPSTCAEIQSIHIFERS